MYSDLLELIRDLESRIGNGAKVKFSMSSPPDSLVIRVDWSEVDFHSEFEIKESALAKCQTQERDFEFGLVRKFRALYDCRSNQI